MEAILAFVKLGIFDAVSFALLSKLVEMYVFEDKCLEKQKFFQKSFFGINSLQRETEQQISLCSVLK